MQVLVLPEHCLILTLYRAILGYKNLNSISKWVRLVCFCTAITSASGSITDKNDRLAPILS